MKDLTDIANQQAIITEATKETKQNVDQLMRMMQHVRVSSSPTF